MIQVLTLWLGLFFIFAGVSGIYFAYLKFYAAKPWGLRIDKSFTPAVTILVPAHNEEKIITSKLENINKVSYPREKIEVIVTDDASTDRTLAEVYDFRRKHPQLNIKVINQNPRGGKAWVLNKALPASNNDIIVVSDADSFWPSEILLKALPYLSDPAIGAVTGSGIIETSGLSWVTQGETNYLKATSIIRLGESKIHSTIRFEGGFCAYKRGAFERFDYESGSDDSGTALQIVQNGFRTLFAPEVGFVTDFPTTLRGKIRVKTRRANQLIRLWIKCLKIMLKGHLVLPKRIAVPEVLLFIFNPLIFVALIAMTFVSILHYPILLIPLILTSLGVSLIPKARSYFVEIALDNIILFYSLVGCIRRKKFVAWDKPERVSHPLTMR